MNKIQDIERTQILEAQDKQLELLLKSIKNQKLIAQTINNELDVQNKLLEELQDNVINTEDKLNMSNKRINKITKNDSWSKWFKSWF